MNGEYYAPNGTAADGQAFELAGRAGVFASATDFAYVPRDSEAVISSAAGKHDEARPGEESELEQVYYFEVSGGENGFGYQRVYGTAERPIDVLAEVRSGDTVLIPHGWHGPSIAAPGYDLYYLNVMAGPGHEQAWLTCDEPAHGWVRGTWHGGA
ncbi:hypothetical protein GCM10010383_56890 [Streptomyces lomondensis]|uniref:5-deoxy-glucuronate isomerase n=1 Tax=Streptomyces lomondensis TaxID=68229 RepID=A0ABQ2XIJ5_9ACTN|nr:hypothetical protein GCM10010383_56890 [Streptomyces lomondensis]